MTEKAKADLRYIRAKLPAATAEELDIIAAVIRALHIVGWSDSEYNRKP